jgi:NDP-sugar pyrophosphorylase family protein
MNILVLMAGEGKRFSDNGYTVPKPLIKVKGKTILEWTTESCPFIDHNKGKQKDEINLFFAVRKEHLDNGLGEFLNEVYGNNITVIPFEKTTRGNLDTARISCEYMKDSKVPILILDADNKYNHNNLDKFLKEIPNDISTMSIVCFDPIDIKTPNKWSNARVRNGFALEIREKDDSWINYPSLIGVFYFCKMDQFKNYADFAMSNLSPVGFKEKKEYYMSMLPCYHASINQLVYVHMVKNVVPLGTPEDVLKFEKDI